jgi:RNA polymerase sigma-70 factor, ECF subfamily
VPPLRAAPAAQRDVHRAAVTSSSGEGGDFDALFRRLYPSLYRYLHRMTGDADAADDMAQESFVRLLGRQMPDDEARLWVFTVATNLLRDRGRTARRRERLLESSDWRPGSAPLPDEMLERSRTVERVRRALEQVPARDRQMLLMREEGFRYDEIARAAGVAPGSVGTLLARAARRFAAVYQFNDGMGDEALG